MAAGGHPCRVVCPTDQGAPDQESHPDSIQVRAFRSLATRPGTLGTEIRDFQPDHVLVSSEDLSHTLLREAAATAPGRIVFLAHTPQFFPFGPESWNPDPAAAALVRDARAIIAIGHHMAGYIRSSLPVQVTVIHPPIYGEPPFRSLGRFGSGFVLMINPCTVKGLSIFLELARKFPDIEFAALKGWGTTSADRAALSSLPNTRLLANVPDIEDVLAEARLLLMPSLWYEGFGLITMEALLRGLPVIASNSGGLLEAKRNTGYVVPVRPIASYARDFDETHMPVPVAPPQEIEPWAQALDRLLTDENEYWNEAARSREAGLAFVSQLDAGDMERFLLCLPVASEPISPPPPPKPDLRLAGLDPARRALLLKKLGRKPS
jgi:glycosyltransferase involved in cell wall biosynthesis